MFYAVGYTEEGTCENLKYSPLDCTQLLTIFLPGFRLRDAALEWLSQLLQSNRQKQLRKRKVGLEEEAFCRTRK
jgi:hypothetical protein